MRRALMLGLISTLLTACATTGASGGATYSESTKVVQQCMENTIVGVLLLPFKGPAALYDVCSDRKAELN